MENNGYKRTLVTPPVYYPLVLDQVKSHLRVDFTDDDKYLQTLISVATERAERYLRRRLVTQTWKVYLDYWPDDKFIILPFGKLSSVTHVKYTDTAGTQTTFTETTYWTSDTDSDPGRIVLVYGESWPTVTLRTNNPIEIQFVCGYGGHTVKAMTAATNASPIVVTITAHGYTTGDEVYIYGAVGNTAANGGWIITKVTDDTFSLNGSTGNGAWSSGGLVIKQAVPSNIRQAILLMLGDMYEHREDVIIGQMQTDLKAARDLMWPLRIHTGATG